MVILLVLVLIFVLELGLLKYLGVRSMRTVHLYVGGLSVPQLVEVGTKASHSFARVLRGRPQAYQVADGVQWDVSSRGGVMSFHVEDRQDGTCHVSAWASRVAPGRVGGVINAKTTWGRSKIMTNWLCAALGIPQNARKLLRQRRRVLRAIQRAGQAVPMIPPPVVQQAAQQSAPTVNP